MDMFDTTHISYLRLSRAAKRENFENQQEEEEEEVVGEKPRARRMPIKQHYSTFFHDVSLLFISFWRLERLFSLSLCVSPADIERAARLQLVVSMM